MRDYRDAKSMAQTLRHSLTTKAVTISHSESLELVSKMLGVADWNTLSALLQADRHDTPIPVTSLQAGAGSYPAIPLRGFVPFPTAMFPIVVGREKTIQALGQAFEHQRLVVVAVQRDAAVDEPGFTDVYEIGVFARLLELEPEPRIDGMLRVLVQAHRRVAIRRFSRETDGFQAEVADVSEGPIPDAHELIQNVIQRFKSYAAQRDIPLPQTSPPLDQTRDPGRVADIIAANMILPVSDKQSVLATLDLVMRLKRVDILMDVPTCPFSPALEATKQRALDDANRRNHQYATLEHLLLALIDDADAAAVMRACDADLGALKASLLGHIDNELKGLVTENADAKPTAAFQRVAQQARRHAQELAWPAVTGANILLTLFGETLSPAARFLARHGVSRERAADFIANIRV